MPHSGRKITLRHQVLKLIIQATRFAGHCRGAAPAYHYFTASSRTFVCRHYSTPQKTYESSKNVKCSTYLTAWEGSGGDRQPARINLTLLCLILSESASGRKVV